MNDLITNFNEKITFSKINIRYFKLSTSKCHTIHKIDIINHLLEIKKLRLRKTKKFPKATELINGKVGIKSQVFSQLKVCIARAVKESSSVP